MQLADRAQLSLDAPLTDYLPQFTGLKGTMTVRQMFSHTAGYGDDSGDPVVFDRSITLAQAVDTIAASSPWRATAVAQSRCIWLFSLGGFSPQYLWRLYDSRHCGYQ